MILTLFNKKKNNYSTHKYNFNILLTLGISTIQVKK